YSSIRPVVFDEEISWQVYPNPSGGIFNFICQASIGDNIDIRIHDINGRQVRSFQQKATGFVQKIAIDLSASSYTPGIYLLETTAGGKKSSFRLIRL
ncbi:MAG: T9SS type A sorting domain-containing protein, partial [Chitinophagaceae bacterium]